MSKYVPSRVATERLGLHPNTLRRLADDDKIEYIRISGQRRYNLDKYIKDNHLDDSDSSGADNKICYCRVSSKKQAKDLDRQIKFLQKRYPHHTIISDVGSGINFKRPGLLRILDQAQQGNITEVVVAYKDRLARIGFELVQHIIETNGGRIVVLNKSEVSEEEDFVQDIISIITVFSAKYHGSRKYKDQNDKNIPKKNRVPEESTEQDSGSE